MINSISNIEEINKEVKLQNEKNKQKKKQTNKKKTELRK